MLSQVAMLSLLEPLTPAALKQVTKDVWSVMRKGCNPAEGAGYSARDYALAVKAILESPFKAVDEDTLENALGKHVVRAMVGANLLALRPYSAWAKDIDPAAYGPDGLSSVVAAPSAMALYLMQKKRDTILEALTSGAQVSRYCLPLF